MKEYVKPELEVISLVTDEAITDDLALSGLPGIDDNPFNK